MNKEQAKNFKVGTRLININTCKVGKILSLDNIYRIYEENGANSDWLNNLDNWYTKEQLKDILVSPLQAINLLQSDDFFNIGDKFIYEENCNLKEIVKENTQSIYINTEGGFFYIVMIKA